MLVFLDMIRKLFAKGMTFPHPNIRTKHLFISGEPRPSQGKPTQHQPSLLLQHRPVLAPGRGEDCEEPPPRPGIHLRSTPQHLAVRGAGKETNKIARLVRMATELFFAPLLGRVLSALLLFGLLLDAPPLPPLLLPALPLPGAGFRHPLRCLLRLAGRLRLRLLLRLSAGRLRAMAASTALLLLRLLRWKCPRGLQEPAGAAAAAGVGGAAPRGGRTGAGSGRGGSRIAAERRYYGGFNWWTGRWRLSPWRGRRGQRRQSSHAWQQPVLLPGRRWHGHLSIRRRRRNGDEKLQQADSAGTHKNKIHQEK